MNETSTHFFPGPRPYREDEAEHFWGRDHFVTQISRYLDHERLVILTSPSGAGKTSLIQAGLIPQLKDNRGWGKETHIIKIRFTPYDRSNPINPLSIFGMILLGHDKAYPNLPYEDESAWLMIKAYLERQYERAPDQRVVLIFDQFEELFTYPEESVAEFLAQLGDIYSEATPPEVSKAIKRKRLLHPNECGSDFQDMVEWLNKPLQTHILLAVEGSALFQVEELITFIPEALSRTHELPPIQTSKVYGTEFQDISEEEREESLFNPWYEYQNPCRNLRLQLLLRGEEFSRAIGQKKAPITPNLSAYYENFLKHLSWRERKQVKAFFEDHLIEPYGKHRRYISEDDIFETLSPNLIQKLEYFGFISPFQHYRAGKSYELSHDCWRRVIIEKKKFRLHNNKLLKGLFLAAFMVLLVFTSMGFFSGVLIAKTFKPDLPGTVFRNKLKVIHSNDTVYSDCPDAKTQYANRKIKSRDITNPYIIDYSLKIRSIDVDTISVDTIKGSNCCDQLAILRDSIRILVQETKLLRDTIYDLRKQLPCPTEKPLDTSPLILSVVHPITGEVQKIQFKSKEYKVKKKETLWDIARGIVSQVDGNTEHDVKLMVDKLIKINGLLNADDIKENQIIFIPAY